MAFGEGPPRTPEADTDLAFRLSDEILDVKVGALQRAGEPGDVPARRDGRRRLSRVGG